MSREVPACATCFRLAENEKTFHKRSACKASCRQHYQVTIGLALTPTLLLARLRIKWAHYITPYLRCSYFSIATSCLQLNSTLQCALPNHTRTHRLPLDQILHLDRHTRLHGFIRTDTNEHSVTAIPDIGRAFEAVCNITNQHIAQ